MSLAQYALRRILLIIPLLIGITFVSFLIANAIPADPINTNLPPSQLNNEAIVAAFRAEWGLDKPPIEQYFTYLGNLLQGNLGRSIKTRQPVAEDIAKFLPATIELATVATVFGIFIGVGLGIVSAVWRNRPIDFIARAVAVIGVSVPVFVLALLFLSVFHAQLGIAAGPGRLTVTLRDPPTVTGLFTVDSLLAGRPDLFLDAASHLILPGLVLALYIAGLISRVTRSSMLEILSMDYMRTARSKGVRESIVVMKHGLRNAMLPIVTVIGLSYGNLLAGAVLTESIFAWPGIGRYMFRASTSQDFPAIMGVSLLIAFIYVVVNFVVDILYYFLDPRIRLS
ncbi:MAG: dipeptide transport system permease dppB [Chloroflexi bacterium OLB15]|nr:MAG: dipeptide transport system permease dppB [Chloroflexi bacterium OLB15]